MTPTLEYITKCRVKGCKKRFVSDPFEIAIIGKPDDKLVKFVSALYEHMAKEHPDHMQNISGSIQQIMGYMVAASFEIQDPQLLAMQEAIRHQLHKVTRRINVTDEQIVERVEATGIDDEYNEDVIGLIQDLRDLLTEDGRYAPQAPAEKPLVTV